MATNRVRLLDGELEVERLGTLPLNELGDGFIGSLDVASPIGLTSLRRALADHFGEVAEGQIVSGVNPKTGERTALRLPPTTIEIGVLQVVDAPAETFTSRHTYEFLPEPVALALVDGGELAARIEFVVQGEREPDQTAWSALLAPVLARHRAAIVAFEVSPEGPMDFRTSRLVTDPDFWVVTVYVSVPSRGRDVSSAIEIGRSLLAVLEAAEHGVLTPASTRSLIESGRADLLVGQPEGPWLDCKGQPYAESDHGKFELAKDVAAFANGGGGLIAIGLQTRAVGGRDVVVAFRPIPRDDRLPDRYRNWLRHRLFPHPADLQIRLINAGPGFCVLLISIPAQLPGLKPFLVKGVLREGRVLGTHVAIFTRRDDATAEASAEELHSLLVAGRVALQYDT